MWAERVHSKRLLAGSSKALCGAVLCTNLLAHATLARTWRVTGDGSGHALTIQAGIDLTSDRDTVLVGAGTYFETVLINKNIHVLSEMGPAFTAIDAQQRDRVITMTAGTLSGFAVRNGQSFFAGGGVYVPFGTRFVCIRNNIIENNTADGSDSGRGGGIYIASDSALVEWNIIRNNHAGSSGGGVIVPASFSARPNRVIIRSNLIRGNSAAGGGGVTLQEGELRDNVIEGNRALYSGGGVYGTGTIANNTIANNTTFNSAANGAGLTVLTEYLFPIEIVGNIVVGNHSTFLHAVGYGIQCLGPGPAIFRCNDIWNNDIDAIGNVCQADTMSANTLFVDPLFCAGASSAFFGPFSVDLRSPVTAPQSGSCGHLGALPAECSTNPVARKSWGDVKSLYR